MHYQAYFVTLSVAQRLRILLSNTHEPLVVFQPFYLTMETDTVLETFFKFYVLLKYRGLNGPKCEATYHQNRTELVHDLLYTFNLVKPMFFVFYRKLVEPDYHNTASPTSRRR
jgi:hypothetical protein